MPPKSVGELLSFQRLSAIVELRNHVAHYFPEFRVPGTWPDRLEPYIKNHTLTPVGDDTMDWTSRLIAGHVSRCKPGSQGCWIGKGSKESFRGRLDKFRVTRAGCFVRICHGRLLSQSRRQWSSIIIRAFSSGVNLKRN